MDQELEKKLTRCPRLGQEISLSYCLQESIDLPCPRIIHCWSYVFDVSTYLQERLSPDLWRKFVNFQPKDKVGSIIELIEAARKRK